MTAEDLVLLSPFVAVGAASLAVVLAASLWKNRPPAFSFALVA